jgi:hypothetical protein
MEQTAPVAVHVEQSPPAAPQSPTVLPGWQVVPSQHPAHDI